MLRFNLLAEERPKAEVLDLRTFVKEKVHGYLDTFEVQKGEQGSRGEPGRRGRRGSVGYEGLTGRAGEAGLQGVQGEKGEKGDTGEPGSKGETGSAPAHQWQRTQLRFRNPDGTWGDFVRLKGETGGKGAGGGGGRSANQGFESVALNGSDLVFSRPSVGPLGQTLTVDLSDAITSVDDSLVYFLGE